MPAYRIYFLDGAGKVSGAEWLEADSDAAALADAQALERRCEVWLRQRYVGRLDDNAPGST